MALNIPKNDGFKAPAYRSDTQSHTYDYDPGYLILPLADGGYSKIRIHEGIGFRSTKWSVAKQDTPPVVPKAIDLVEINQQTGVTTVTAEFLGGTLAAPLPKPNPNGTGYDWEVAGSYNYVLTTPNAFDGTEGIPTGDFPFYTSQSQLGVATLVTGFGPGFNNTAPVDTTSFSTFDPDDVNIDFNSVYSWPWPYKLGKQFFSDGIVRG